MNILYHFRTRGTGAEGVHISGIASALERLGHSVTFSSPTGTDPRMTAGADPFGGGGKGGLWRWVSGHAPTLLFELLELGYNLAALSNNGRILRKSQVDLIYERHAYFLCATALLARAAKVPLVVEVNELIGDERVRPEPTLSFAVRMTDKLTFAIADAIVTVSPHLKRRLVERGVDADKILVQPNAVATADVEQVADGGPVRARYQVGNAKIIGFVGWLVEWHKLEWLVEAFAALRSRHRDIKLMMVGNGPLRDQLHAQAEALGVADDIIFTGAVDRAEVYSHIAAFDVAAIPHSNAYRSPIKAFEYMAQARAMVAPRTEPLEMVVSDGENGLLFDIDGAAPLERAIDRVLSDESLRQRIGDQARRDVLAHHTWQANVEELLANLAAR